MLLITPGGTIFQGRSCVFKSGTAEEVIECRRHEGGEHERGDYSPSRQGGLGGLPREFFFLIWGASMCVFNGGFMPLGPDFSRFGHDLLLGKIFLVRRETECWTKLFSDSHDFFLLFFYSMFL